MRNKWLELSLNKRFEFDLLYNGIFYAINIKKNNEKSFTISEISSNSVVASMINSGNFNLNAKCDLQIHTNIKTTTQSSMTNINNLEVVAYSSVFNSSKTGLIHSIVFKARKELNFIKKYL